MSFKKQMSFNRGFTHAAAKGQEEIIRVETRKRLTVEPQAPTQIPCEPLDRPDTGTPSPPCIIFLFGSHNDIHGHECYKNNIQ